MDMVSLCPGSINSHPSLDPGLEELFKPVQIDDNMLKRVDFAFNSIEEPIFNENDNPALIYFELHSYKNQNSKMNIKMKLEDLKSKVNEFVRFRDQQ
jgi:hypothetical protein